MRSCSWWRAGSATRAASAASRAADPTGCQNGYIRLDDERYEARDAQYAAGLLVDEGIADPNRIGATGESYGGGVSLELATLKDRVMNTDGTLSPVDQPRRDAAAHRRRRARDPVERSRLLAAPQRPRRSTTR